MNLENIKECHAKKFKLIVKVVEKLKWNLIKKYDKNYLKRNEKLLLRKKNKLLQKATNEKEKKFILSDYKSNLIILRKEYYSEENINYHLNALDPKAIKKYLEQNKKVHKNWLIVDGILLGITSILIILGYHVLIDVIGTVYVCLEAIKNLECINLQNYSIDKVTKMEKSLEKIKKRKVTKELEKHKEAHELIYEKINQGDDLVTTKDLMIEIEKQDLSTLIQVREMLEKECSKRKNNEKEKTFILK